MWGCVRATRSLHDEVSGIWFTSWPLFFLIFLQLLLTLLLLLSSSSIVAVLIAKAGHVWVSWPEEFLLYFLSLTLQKVCYCQGIDYPTQSGKDVKQQPYPVVSLSGPFCSFLACREQSGFIKTNSSAFYLHIIIWFCDNGNFVAS